MRKYLNLRANIALGLIFAFLANIFGPLPVYAQDFRLPAPGVRVGLSPEFNPPILKGIKVHPDNPFRFDFILDQGDSSVIPAKAGIHNQEQLKQEATKLIKYFLASLTIPEKDLWVNLSPYEKNRIVPESFGRTEMGRDLLAEDYMLKQITASLIYPEGETGKKFWKRIYEEAAKKFGTTNIPVNTFNKVWIVPSKAVVYENAKAGTAYVVESKLKVMLEQDYLALSHNVIPVFSSVIPAKAGIHNKNDINALGSQIVREIVIPELTKEVNENKNFSQLRQVYNSLILATWYKKKIKDSILEQVYANKNKVAGVSIDDPQEKERIYERYLQAFKKGAYNYIKEEIDPTTQQTIPRKYFSGGMGFAGRINGTIDTITNIDKAQLGDTYHLAEVSANIDQAMSSSNAENKTKIVQIAKVFMKAFGLIRDMFETADRSLSYDGKILRDVAWRGEAKDDEILGTTGALSCSPIVIYETKGEQRKIHILHYMIIGLLENPGIRGLDFEKSNFFLKARGIDFKNSTVIIPHDIRFRSQYDAIATAIGLKYPTSRVLRVEGGVDLMKTSVAVPEGMAIIESEGNIRDAKYANDRFMPLTWDEINSLFETSVANVLTIKFRPDQAMAGGEINKKDAAMKTGKIHFIFNFHPTLPNY